MRTETKELLISWLTLSVAFSFYGANFFNLGSFAYLLPISLVAVGTGFIFHELAHRYVARRYGCYAEYRMWQLGLLLALFLPIVTLGNFFFAAPGAVYIACEYISRRKEAYIALAGPLANIMVGIFFLFVAFATPFSGYVLDLVVRAAYLNFFLAFFNLVPIPPLDGSKVFAWNPILWAVLFLPLFYVFYFPL